MQALQNTQRKMFLDVARGISMICIVLGHLGVSSLNRIVFTFHLPVFFLLSGYFIDLKRPWKELLKHKVRTLIVPYYFSCLLMLIASICITVFVYREQYTMDSLISFLKAVIYSSGDHWTEPFEIPAIGALWFLWATFFGCILLRLVTRLKPLLQVPVVFAIFAAGKLTADAFFIFPLSIQPACCALLFMYVGFLVRNTESVFSKTSRALQVFALLFAAWVWIDFIRNFKSFWLVHCDVGRGVIDIFGALCASAVVFFISKLLADYVMPVGRALSFLGRNSIIFLCAHVIEMLFPYSVLITKLFGEIGEVPSLLLIILLKFVWIIPVTVLFANVNWIRKVFGLKRKA